MSTTIERLRASKEMHINSAFTEGETDGHEWARDYAEYPHLVAIDKLDVSMGDDDDTVCGELFEAIKSVDGELDTRDILDQLVGDDHEKPMGYWAGFVKGAQKLFSEVKDQI